MEPSGGVAQHHVHPPGPGGLEGVKQHRAGVCPLVLADDLTSGPLRPDLQLVGGGGPEGVRGAQQHPLAPQHQKAGHLADGGGLAHAVDADEQHDAGRGGDVELRGSHVQQLHQHPPQGRADLLLVLELLPPHGLPQPLHGLRGGLHPQVRQNQRLLQLLEKGLVRLGEGGEEIGGDLFQLVKKTHGILLESGLVLILFLIFRGAVYGLAAVPAVELVLAAQKLAAVGAPPPHIVEPQSGQQHHSPQPALDHGHKQSPDGQGGDDIVLLP